MKITITNTFHNSSVNMIIKGDSVKLSQYQVKRAERELCGMDCSCGSMWSYAHTIIGGYDNYHLEPLMDRRTGEITGAELVKD